MQKNNKNTNPIKEIYNLSIATIVMTAITFIISFIPFVHLGAIATGIAALILRIITGIKGTILTRNNN
ncbi:UNVERIFIED_CONTAM: hypothetical protein O8I53_08275 [Campylobacter lari]